jgi:hypothetical protein
MGDEKKNEKMKSSTSRLGNFFTTNHRRFARSFCRVKSGRGFTLRESRRIFLLILSADPERETTSPVP